MSIYLVGSLRNPEVPKIAKRLIHEGFDIFSDWFAAGKIADDSWQEYETLLGRTYIEALNGIAADHVFQFDKFHLNRCDSVILVAPAGRSGHIEFGYMLGQKKPGYYLLDKPPDRWDVMLKFATGVFFDLEELIKELKCHS